ncbi:hypothetical protein N9Z35_01785 [Alphaproteobacteria bacterium]|nr:hypothetical protein [Alphaproteobacteria bacterium]MDB2700239.1 hypothetical protein [Alphaproteobacteria bacterium]|tara:strand:- start:132 stop:737 length:606 start_codon:yes stop_codon:yes gene_type:complete
MMKYLITVIFIFLTNYANAGCYSVTGQTTVCGPATQYEVSVSKVELCTESTCGTAVTVADTAAVFDIAAASAGAAVGSYADLNGVTPGTYTHIRSTVSSTIKYTAVAKSPCSAVSANTSFTLTRAKGVVNGDLSAENLAWAVNDVSFYHTVALSAPLLISSTAPLPQIKIDFSTLNAHLCISGSSASYPGPPVMTVTVNNN